MEIWCCRERHSAAQPLGCLWSLQPDWETHTMFFSLTQARRLTRLVVTAIASRSLLQTLVQSCFPTVTGTMLVVSSRRSTRSLPRMAASQCPATSTRACFGGERSDSPTAATFRSKTFRASRHSVAPELPSLIRQSLVCYWRICFTSVERSRASHPTSADCSVTCSARETAALGNRILGLWTSATWLRTSRARESSCSLHARLPASSTS